jgi:hypothetical protein
MNAREKPQLDGLPTLQDGQCKSTVLSSQAEVSVDLRQPRASTRGHDQTRIQAHHKDGARNGTLG